LHFLKTCSVVLAAWVVLGQSVLAAPGDATRRFITADSSKGRIALIDEAGKTAWEYKIGPLHDLAVLPNGNVLFQTSWTRLVEVDPKTNKVVWEYDAGQKNGNAGKAVEVHAFQRLANGHTMIAESGVSRIIEVDADGTIQRQIKLQVKQPSAHHDTRLVRKLENGNYLVCHEAEGLVREYTETGDIAWEYPVPLFDRQAKEGHGVEAFGNQCFTALRLNSGNTLLSTGNGHSVLEVSPDKKIVWSLHQNDLPGIQLAWVTTLQVLPSGNIVIGNCHAGPKNPQIVEVSRDKKVVWTFRDFDRFGDSTTNTQVLAVDGKQVQ
jgi:outer membrane protein assembly factor BamB